MDKGIYEKLKEYAQSDYYPMHMPGHKRNSIGINLPYSIDITEVEGFDNLHDAQGIIEAAQVRAAKLYGVKQTFFLINGSTGGILSAISACCRRGDNILMARNCHKSAYNGAMINGLNLDYISPKALKNLGICGSICVDSIRKKMENNPNVKAVFITSPTYEGLVSDIKGIADVVHNNGGILIVDEAHGSHLKFLDTFPVSAIQCGADIVIQSAHKTLPALTQSAFLHVCTDRVDLGRLKTFLSVYQSSSPSYILMAGLDACVNFLENEGKKAFEEYSNNIAKARKELKSLNKLRLLDRDYYGESFSRDEMYDYDPGKLVITCGDTDLSGVEIKDILRDKYHIECEMAGVSYVIAMTSLMDTEAGLNRFVTALKEIDQSAEIKIAKPQAESLIANELNIKMKISDAMDSKQESIMIEKALGRISGEYIYVYPPGCPLIAPGEEITEEILKKYRHFKALGLEVCGAEGLRDDLIKVVIC